MPVIGSSPFPYHARTILTLIFRSIPQQTAKPTPPEEHLRPPRLQPPPPLTFGRNRRSRSSSRASPVDLCPVVASPSLRSRRNAAGARHLHASPANLIGNLARGEPLPSFYSSCRISFGYIGLDHLTEEVLPDLHRPDPLKIQRLRTTIRPNWYLPVISRHVAFPDSNRF
jgi:hypothetical protein